MFEKLRKKFTKRGRYSSPYYGGVGALFQGSAVPLRPEPVQERPKEPAVIETPAPVRYTPRTSESPDWERLRFELFKMLVGQERRSVVLGKLKSTNKQIANTCRVLTDAAIRELQLHPLKSHEEDDERGDHADERGGERPQARD